MYDIYQSAHDHSKFLVVPQGTNLSTIIRNNYNQLHTLFQKTIMQFSGNNISPAGKKSIATNGYAIETGIIDIKESF